MSNVRRVYVEKKPAYAVQAKELKHEISSYLGIKSATNVRVLIRYDVENISDEVFEKACRTVFAEPPVDDLYQNCFTIFARTGPLQITGVSSVGRRRLMDITLIPFAVSIG